MLKQLLSVSDVKKLKTGDRLSDHSDFTVGKIYTIENVSHGLIYAINHHKRVELKILTRDKVPEMPWWVCYSEEPERETFPF